MYVEENTKHFVTLHSTGAEVSNLQLIQCIMLHVIALWLLKSKGSLPYLLQQIGCEFCKLSGATVAKCVFVSGNLFFRRNFPNIEEEFS